MKSASQRENSRRDNEDATVREVHGGGHGISPRMAVLGQAILFHIRVAAMENCW
jgi:hypothetical protein